jgi:DNA repair protein RecN (Recombination protein N)
MLHQLTITDFAIIQHVRLDLSSGLIIFTGETGAGKSIVLDAIGALLGDRIGADVVRAGQSRAIVEGVFVLPWLPKLLTETVPGDTLNGNDHSESITEEQPDPHQTLAWILREYGVASEDDMLILAREIAANGRGVARVNGRAIPMSVLGRIGSLLVDVHGQGAHLALLRPEHHIDYLDRAAETLTQRQRLADTARQWQAYRRELSSLRTNERELERRAELLRYQVDEISSANLHPEEMSELERERQLLGNAERLRELSESVYLTLTGDTDSDTAGVLDQLASTERALSELVRLDPTLATTQSALDDSRYQLEDIAATLRDYRDSAESDPQRLAEIEDRIDRINRLRRKYGATIEEILAYGETSSIELNQIEHRDERIAELESLIERQRNELGRQAIILSQMRQQAATSLSAAMEQALDRLNMRNARFFIQIEQHEHPDGVPGKDGARYAISPTGIDRVEFLIAPNPGEPPRPLAKIASGGETARLMLALKSILASADATPTLIFDEVDAGISGLTGQIVGEMLWHLSRQHQVLCVTHLPQLAAFGDQHWHVAKHIAEGRTTTIVHSLDPAERTLEIAQMLGGVATESAARNAAELIDRAANWKDHAQQNHDATTPQPAARTRRKK